MRLLIILCTMLVVIGIASPISSQPASPACDRDTRKVDSVIVKTPLGEAKGLLCLDDGDSFSIGPAWIRLKGIDAPRVGRNCIKHFGSGATPKRCEIGLEILAQLDNILSVGTTCESEKRDSRNRWLSSCSTTDGRDVSAEMVRLGFACAATRYEKTYVHLEHEARRAKRGLWADGIRYVPSEMCTRDR